MNDKQLFSMPIHAYKEHVKETLKRAVEHAPEREIADADDGYTGRLLSRYKFEPLSIDWDQTIHLTGRHERKEVAQDFVWGQQEVVRQVYTFEVAYTGSKELLYIKPSTSRMWRFEPEVDETTIQFEIADRGNEQANKMELQSIKENLEHDVAHLNSELSAYHSEIATYAEHVLQQRKARIESAVQGMGGFGVPVRGLNFEPED